MGRIEELPGTSYLGGCTLCHIFHSQMRAEIDWVTAVNKLKKWSFFRLSHEYQLQFVTILPSVF